MGSLFPKFRNTAKNMNMGNNANFRSEKGEGPGVGEELRNLSISTNTGPYAPDNMDQFEKIIDFDSPNTTSDLGDNKAVKDASIFDTANLQGIPREMQISKLMVQQKSDIAIGSVRAACNLENLIGHSIAGRVLSKNSRDLKRDQQPRQVERAEEMHDKIKINNLVMSISQYTSSDKLLDEYWNFDALRLRVTGRKSEAADNKQLLAIDLRHCSKAAYLLHGCKVDMRVLTDWIPMRVWTSGLTEESVREITREMESKITSSLLTTASSVVEQWMRIAGFPKLPKTVSDLFTAFATPKSQARRAKFKMLIEGHDLEAYRWIEDTLDIFKDILPLRAILSDKSPLNLIRDHLIAMTIAWASIHYDTVLLKAVQCRLQREHEAECAALQSQQARPESGLVRDSEMLEMLSDGI